jgi:anti-anti-sigma regulatory factor
MEISMCGNLIVGICAPGIQVVRIAQPDLTVPLDGGGHLERCELVQELYDTVLATLGEGETVVLNLGLVESFPPLFFGFLLWVRQVVKIHKGRLVLCGLEPGAHKVLQTASIGPAFHITGTEEQAIREANL